jgi:hypothetical protein
MSDPQVEDGDKAAFLDVVGDALNYVAGTAGEIAAGYTRPLDIYSRVASVYSPEAGGGVVVDRKQAEGGVEKFTLGLTRYVSGFMNYAFGEEDEYGNRVYGKPRESAISEGPATIPNPLGTLVGTTLQKQSRSINKLLGMVDKPPYKADSFTSGVPEYDAFINKHVTPELERRAKGLLNNKHFLKAPQSIKIELVNTMIQEARDQILSDLDGYRIGDNADRLTTERMKLLTRDRQARVRAKRELGITTDDHKLSLFEIEAIRRYIDFEKGTLERIK